MASALHCITWSPVVNAASCTLVSALHRSKHKKPKIWYFPRLAENFKKSFFQALLNISQFIIYKLPCTKIFGLSYTIIFKLVPLFKDSQQLDSMGASRASYRTIKEGQTPSNKNLNHKRINSQGITGTCEKRSIFVTIMLHNIYFLCSSVDRQFCF